MGNAESTLAFKNQLNRLETQKEIPAKDPIWATIVNACVDHHQVFGVVTLEDLRRVREAHPENLEELLRVLVRHFSSVIRPSGIGSAIAEQVLGHLRALARLIPVIYEERRYAKGIEEFLWGANGVFVELLEALLRTAQLPGFCIPLGSQDLWAAGIGARSVQPCSKENQYNRVELVRVLLVLLGEPVYCLKAHGLELLASKPVGEVAYLFCSLANSGSAGAGPLAALFGSKLPRLALTTLMLLVVHHGERPNTFRKLLATVHRQEDLRALGGERQDCLARASLVWELVQANPKFGAVPAAPIVGEILAKQYEHKQDDFVRILTFLLIHQSRELGWCGENAQAMARLYSAFAAPTVHTPALLDLLHNLAPLLELRGEQVEEFAGFVDSCMVSGNKSYAESLLASLESMGPNAALGALLQGRALAALEAAPRPFVPVRIEWDAAKMRWYTSALWGHAITEAEMKGGVSPWKNTEIKMAKVETLQPWPMLRNPRGAVEEIGNVIWGWVRRSA